MNALELLGSTGFHWTNEDSSSVEPSSSFLLILPENVPCTDCPLQSISKLYLQFLDQVVKFHCSINFSRN